MSKEEIAALKKQYDTTSKDDKFEEEMIFKGMVKEEIQDNKRRKRVQDELKKSKLDKEFMGMDLETKI